MNSAAAMAVHTALEFLADKHGVSVEEILTAYFAGAEAVVAQVTELSLTGFAVIEQMMEAS